MKKFFLAASVLFSVHLLAQSYTPSVQLTAGKKYSVISSNKGSISQEVMGQTMEIPMDVVTYSTLEVKAVTPEGTLLSSTTSKITLSVNMMGQEINYDSDKKEDREGQIGEAMKGQLNQTVTCKVDGTGKIIAGSMVKPAVPSGEVTSNPMLTMLGLSENDLGISPAVNLFNTAAEIKPGASFTDTNGSSADGKLKTSLTYTLAEIKDGIARFTIIGTNTLVKEMEMQGTTANVNTLSKFTGEMMVEVATGLLVKKILHSAITGTTEVAGMTIPQTGAMELTVAVTEIK